MQLLSSRILAAIASSVMHFVHKILKFSRGKSRGRRSVTFHCFRSKGASWRSMCLCVCKTQIFPHHHSSEDRKRNEPFFPTTQKPRKKRWPQKKKISAIEAEKSDFHFPNCTVRFFSELEKSFDVVKSAYIFLTFSSLKRSIDVFGTTRNYCQCWRMVFLEECLCYE